MRSQKIYDLYVDDIRQAADFLDCEGRALSIEKDQSIRSAVVEEMLKQLASDLSLEYKPRPPMVLCAACSRAGGADRAIYHEAPACGE